MAERAAPEVTVLLFAATRDAAGGTARTVQALPAGASVSELLDVLCARYPRLAAHRPTLRVAVNETYVDAAARLQDGDEVALIPPVCGG